MLCYKDKTFCPFWISCKKGKKCDRKLDDITIEKAKKLGLYICKFEDKPTCFKED